MSLANKPLDQITEADLQELIDNQVAEGKEYDYKLLVGGSDDEKREFLADASSFANTIGGHLIIGMDEDQGIPTAIRELHEDKDAFKLRLEEILRTGIAPRIRFEIQPVPVSTGNVFVIRIPQSWASPHMVTFRNYSRFFARHSAGKYQLDVHELRSAFTLSETAAERIRSFRFDQIAKIVADETPIKLSAGAKLVLHIAPFATPLLSNTFASLHPDKIIEWQQKFDVPIVITSFRYNLDGLLFYGRDTSGREKYIQIFRNGAVEFTDTWFLNAVGPVIQATRYEQTLLDLLPSIFSVQEQLGVQAPIVIMLTLLGVKDYTTGHVGQHGILIRLSDQIIDRNNLLVPDVIIEDFSSNLSQKLKPVFDPVWQACGLPQSKNYDSNGNWKPFG